MSAGSGFLAIWSDISREDETDYLHWLTREHIAERLSVPGFLAARVFVSKTSEARRYFILYDLASAGVMSSDAYLDRLNNPTSWSRRIMPRITNFRRGGGTVLKKIGGGQGGVVAVLETGTVERLLADAPSLTDRVCAFSALAADAGPTNIATVEKSLRGGDGSFQHLMLIEALDAEAIAGFFAARCATANGLQCSRSAVYDLVFSQVRSVRCDFPIR